MKIEALFQKRDLTSGSIPKNLVIITIPLWIGSGFYLLLPPWELYLVGRIGPEAIAALTIGGAGQMLFWVATLGLANVAIALIGGLSGQKNNQAVNQMATEILTITFVLSILLAITGYWIAPGLLSLLGAKSEVLNMAIPYLRVLLVGGIVTSPVFVINGFLRGAGEMKLPMVIICSVILLNTVLLPFLVLGWGFFPEMGLNGTALAYIISMGMGTVFSLWVLCRGKSVIKIDLGKNWGYSFPRLTTVKEIINLAGTNTLEMLSMSIFSLVMLGLVAGWGTYALAAYGIGQRLLMMVSLPGFDLATATNILMANNLGAQEIRRAELSTRWASGINALIMGFGGVMIFSLAPQTMGVFDKSHEVVEMGTGYLRVTTPGWLLLAVWFILRRAFIGAKDARTPFLLTIFGSGVLQLSSAFYLARMTPLGISGIWLAILTAAVFQGLASAVWFQLGKWKEPKIRRRAKQDSG